MVRVASGVENGSFPEPMMVRVASGVENVEFPRAHDRALRVWGRE